MDACDKLAKTVAASLQDCDPERLGLHRVGRNPHSRVLEFLGLLLDAESQSAPLPPGRRSRRFWGRGGASSAPRPSNIARPQRRALPRYSG
ncbi:MAG: hypothetical protein WDM77_00120 [Steroidobacteraceae bacterium]